MKTEELTKKYLKIMYFDYELIIASETPTEFVITNNGNSVGKDDSINTQFMAFKDSLGFKLLEPGHFERNISKLDPNLKLFCLKIASYKRWLVRIIDEKDDMYLAVVNGTKPETGWDNIDDFYLKWISKNQVVDLVGTLGI